MKSIKKMLALVIAGVMVLGMSTMAFAAEGDVKLSVSSPVDGHTYKYLQLFTGDLSGSKDSKLSNVKWGANVASPITYKKKATPDATEFTVDETATPTAGQAVPQEILDYVASLASNQQDTADILSAWVTGTGTEISAGGVDVAPGYYVVKDEYTDPNARQTTTLSTNMIAVIDDVAITPKAGTTEHKKEVLDNNDSNTKLDTSNLQNIAEGWDKTADHDFGDSVPFKLTTKIGSDYAKYDAYKLYVHDTLGAGLKLEESTIKVFVGGVEATKGATDGYTVEVSGQTFTVKFDNLTANTNAAAGKEVVVYYTAKLDEATAVIGNPGNPNTSYAEFSNNPNGDQGGTAKTPEDKAVVFTMKTVVDKVDENKKPLKGAAFTLYKKDEKGVYQEVKVITSAGEPTTFSFEGLDDGDYKIVETATPAGYNSIEPVEFTLSAVHTSTNGIESINGKTEGEKIDLGEFEAQIIKTSGIQTSIVNKSGTVLPSTGGIGTTIFYAMGAILVLGAGILLVSKRRAA